MSAIDRAFIRAYETDDDAPLAAPAARRVAPPRPAPMHSAPNASSSAMSAATAAPYSQGPAPPHFRMAAEHPSPVAAPPAAGATASERRPLSAFAAPAAPVEARFRPELEVDAYRWSAASDALVRNHAYRWRDALEAIMAADERGCSLIGVAGVTSGVGATTITGCLARLLVAAGKTVAVVDGNFTTPGLASSLSLAVELGWEDVLAGRVQLADAVIHSIDDCLAVLPLTQGGLPAAEKLDAIHASITAGVLRYHYDLVLFDLGAIGDPQQAPVATRLARRCRLDGVVLATTPRAAARDAQQLAKVAPELAAVCFGVVENQALSY